MCFQSWQRLLDWYARILGPAYPRPPARPSVLQRECRQLASMMRPVTSVFVLVSLIVWSLDMRVEGSDPFVKLLPYYPGRHAYVSVASLAAGSIFNGLLLLSTVIFATLLFVVLFRFKLRRVCIFILALAFTVAVSGCTVYIIRAVCARYRVPLDWITLGVFSYNFVAVGLATVYVESWVEVLDQMAQHWGNAILQIHSRYILNGYLVLYTVALCWPFCCMHEWTVWTTLVLLIIWDLAAVLTPCGPLRYIMKLEERRARSGLAAFELPPGLIYETPLFRLGTGDILFYGVVLGRAASVSFSSTVMVAGAIYMGIVATIWATLRSDRHAIPALPIALVLGIVIYFCSHYVTNSYVQQILSLRTQI